ncbi:MAG: PIN domain-containing protein [Verrucomicrobiota bacterium]
MATQHLVDTNVLVRFFTGQPPDMAAKAKALVAAADAGNVVLEVLPITVAETIYTLESFYGLDRKDVAAKVLAFLLSRGVQAHERDRIIDALEHHRDYNVHFADAYLAAAGAELKFSVASFDRDLDKFKDVKRHEPKG